MQAGTFTGPTCLLHVAKLLSIRIETLLYMEQQGGDATVVRWGFSGRTACAARAVTSLPAVPIPHARAHTHTLHAW